MMRPPLFFKNHVFNAYFPVHYVFPWLQAKAMPGGYFKKYEHNYLKNNVLIFL